ncbi:hypothetical protein [Arthrobacter sp. NPDC056727]|uniref:hypothetical protein n=1 Tax=Arthrobacter sp. NPDC056727 TaxID=3345927 RepID=UPI00367184A8
MTAALSAPSTAPAPAGTKVVADWTALIPGDFVTVLEQYSVRHTGWIDDLTADGGILWLVRAFGGGRRMFCRENGDIVTVEAA